MNRRRFLKRTLIAGPIAIGSAMAYGRYLERHAVEVVQQNFDLDLGRSSCMAVLGDLHFDPLFEVEYLERVIALLNEQSPDLVLYTGDFLSKSASRLDELITVLRRATPRLGSFAILGNHDHGIDAERISSGLAKADIRTLRNESVALPIGSNLFLTGLESFWTGRPSTDSLKRTPPDSKHIVLAHEPDSFDQLADPRIVLQLSGHTHGGQIRLPGVGAICLPSWGKKYSAGLFEQKGRQLYVNRGIGTVDEHYRLNCPPEITVLEMV